MDLKIYLFNRLFYKNEKQLIFQNLLLVFMHKIITLSNLRNCTNRYII
jgi:hypothetical protein